MSDSDAQLMAEYQDYLAYLDYLDSPGATDSPESSGGLSVGAEALMGIGGSVPEPEGEMRSPGGLLANELRAIKNRGTQGVIDMLGSAEEFAPAITKGGPRMFGLNPVRKYLDELNPLTRNKPTAKETLTAASELTGLLGEEEAETPLGTIAGEVAYYAPGMLGNKGAAVSTLLGGTGAGIAKASGASEGGQAAAGLAGSLTPAAFTATLRKTFPWLKNAGAELKRASVGVRQTDYTRSAKELDAWDIVDDEVETATKKAIDYFTEQGKFGDDRVPAKLAARGMKEAKRVNNEIGRLIDDYTGVVTPKFGKARAYLKAGRIAATEVDRYDALIDNIETQVRNKGKGSLRYLQNQKTAYGGKWNPNDKAESGFWRALYSDLKESIEDAVPEVGELNAEASKWRLVIPILKRNVGGEEGRNIFKALRQLIRTSGGTLTTPTILGGILGGGVGGPLGMAGGVGLAMGGTPAGQLASGRALQALGAAGERVPQLAPNVLGAIRGAYEATGDAQEDAGGSGGIGVLSQQGGSPRGYLAPKEESLPGALRMEKKTKPRAQNVSAVEAEIDADPIDSAIYEMESSRNPSAKNPNSTAAGGFQLIESMQKALGVKDPYDLRQNYDGYKVLRAQHEAEFGSDPETLYAAHYLGATTLRKWLRGGSLNSQQERHVRDFKKTALPRFKSIYNRIISV